MAESGNQSDGPAFADILQEFDQQWDVDALFVMDAVFYSETNLKTVAQFNWLSPVPQTISAAKALIVQSTNDLTAVDCTLQDYQLWEVPQTYGGIEQRWRLIESASRKANHDLWEKELQKLERRLNRDLKQLKQTVFACKPDAYEA